MHAKLTLVIGLIAGLALAGPAMAADAIEAFYGTYVGQAVLEKNGEVSKRDLNVVIKPFRKGFTVEWTTVSQKKGGETKRASYNINFRPTKRDGIYESAMKINKFGKGVPLDPIKGDPYVWARLENKTLTVYAMIITDEGGFEMQTYVRTLTSDGMKLEFSRVRDGVPLRKISATRSPK